MSVAELHAVIDLGNKAEYFTKKEFYQFLSEECKKYKAKATDSMLWKPDTASPGFSDIIANKLAYESGKIAGFGMIFEIVQRCLEDRDEAAIYLNKKENPDKRTGIIRNMMSTLGRIA
jgi:hypothetical protein